jgi:hypothetical protein
MRPVLSLDTCVKATATALTSAIGHAAGGAVGQRFVGLIEVAALPSNCLFVVDTVPVSFLHTQKAFIGVVLSKLLRYFDC